MSKNNYSRIADFLFEIGTMRKLLRSHRQALLTDDLSDNIASHSYRVAMIGWMLAEEEQADISKVIMMCLLHDIGEIRTGDHNYIQKKYVKEFNDDVIKDQLETLPYERIKEIALEYEKRESREAKIAKDADLLDQILLLREYAWQGNREAQIWLEGKGEESENVQYKNLQTETARKVADSVLEKGPSDWWSSSWTPKNRK